MAREDEDGNGKGNKSKRELFESLMPKFGMSDEDMTVENVQKVMKANAAAPMLFWDRDPFPSHDPIRTSDWDFGEPGGGDRVETVDFPIF
jgi:hypothetical protein